jgi:hypothetical protein
MATNNTGNANQVFEKYAPVIKLSFLNASKISFVTLLFAFVEKGVFADVIL